MSWATNYKGFNNIHSSIPPRMEDGRILKTYQLDQDLLNNNLLKDKYIKTNQGYRDFLKKNADTIIDKNSVNTLMLTGTPTLFNNKNEISNTPYIFEDLNDKQQPYGYEQSNLKNYYLTRESLDARLHEPSFVMTKDD